MVREFMEVNDPQIFQRVAEQSPLVIRRDPFLFAQYFAMMFFINLARLEKGNVKTLFETLKGKLIIVENIVQASTITEFIEKGAEP
jgi:hypothetical protein